MKKLLLITICILLLNGCDNKPKLPGTFVGSAGTISRRLLSETPEGYFIVQDYYNEQFAYTEPFVIKRQEDLIKGLSWYDRFGSALDLIDSIDGPITLNWIGYFQTEPGSIILKGQYNEGKREGLWQGFYRDGRLAFQENYQQGKLEGKQQRRYYSSPRSEYYFRDGVVEGKSMSWYEDNNRPLAELNFYNGLRAGAYRYWHANGQLWIEGQFDNDKKQGQWTYWNHNGDKQKIINYNQGAVVSEKELAPAFENVKIDINSRNVNCGSYQGHILGIENEYIPSMGYRLKKRSSNGNKCKDELNHVYLGYYWPSLNPATSGSMVRRIKYEVSADWTYVSLEKQLDTSLTITAKDKWQPVLRVRDPETGLWRHDRLNQIRPSKVYWDYNDQGEVAFFIECGHGRSMGDMECRLVTYMPQYNVFIILMFLERLLPQWPALEEQAKQFIERRIQN